MKNSLMGLITYWRWQEKRISKSEDRLTESIQSEKIRKKQIEEK